MGEAIICVNQAVTGVQIKIAIARADVTYTFGSELPEKTTFVLNKASLADPTSFMDSSPRQVSVYSLFKKKSGNDRHVPSVPQTCAKHAVIPKLIRGRGNNSWHLCKQQAKTRAGFLGCCQLSNFSAFVPQPHPTAFLCHDRLPVTGQGCPSSIQLVSFACLIGLIDVPQLPAV